MRTVPARPALTRIVTVFSAFALGPLASMIMASWLVPGSGFTETVASLALVLVFVGGTVIWMGFGVGAAVIRAAGRLGRGPRPRPATAADREDAVPQGYRVYTVLGGVLGTGVGLIAALTTDLGVLASLGAWGGLGLGYGALLTAAAHHGFLPFPEPE